MHAYCDASGAARPVFTGVKIRSYPAYAGLTSFGLAAANQRLSDEISRLFARLGYRGIADLDLRQDPRDGSYKLLDFNPRLGAQFRLFRDWAGLDVVTAAYLDQTGQPYAVRGQVSGRRFVVENYDPLGALAYWRAGELGPASWLRSLYGVEETAWFAWDDLLPFGLMSVRMAARAGRAFARAPGRRSAGARRPTEPACPAGSLIAERGNTMNEAVDVAIVGAGPYGLSLAAHLRKAGVSMRQFGHVMHLWRTAMPAGMFLKSQGFASNLSDPDGTHTLRRVLRGDRPSLRRLRPAGPAGHLHRLRPVVHRAARAGRGGDPGHRHHRRARLLRADPGHRGAGPGPPGGRRRRRRALRLAAR